MLWKSDPDGRGKCENNFYGWKGDVRVAAVGGGACGYGKRRSRPGCDPGDLSCRSEAGDFGSQQ
ncbi:hypothetical protein D3C80_1603700 [compost metagenome]